MGLQINTNEVSLAAQRNLEATDRRYKNTVQRLASGSKIVQASDDPAGLAISDSLEATIRSMGAATKNAQDGVSLIQVYEGGTNEINNMLVRMRELAIQSSSDSIGNRERAMLDNEVQQLKQEIDRLASSTKFNGQELLSGDAVNMEFQVGPNNDPDVDRIRFNPGDTNLKAAALGVDGFSVADREDARSGLESIDEALTRVNEIRARVGASQGRLQTTIAAQQIYAENLMAAKSRIRDADLAKETADLAKDSILRQAGVAVLGQANQTPALALSLLRA
jgi:flagellin